MDRSGAVSIDRRRDKRLTFRGCRIGDCYSVGVSPRIRIDLFPAGLIDSAVAGQPPVFNHHAYETILAVVRRDVSLNFRRDQELGRDPQLRSHSLESERLELRHQPRSWLHQRSGWREHPRH